MLSRTGLYALQAALHLAQQSSDSPVSAARVAGQLQVSADYMAKVLHRLSREGILASSRGARGGYRLTRNPGRISVEEVVAPFEDGPLPKICLLGGHCDPDAYCTAHAHRLQWVEVRRRLLRETTVADLLEPPSTELLEASSAIPAQNKPQGREP